MTVVCGVRQAGRARAACRAPTPRARQANRSQLPRARQRRTVSRPV